MWHAYLVFAGLLAEADVAVAELGGALRRTACAESLRDRAGDGDGAGHRHGRAVTGPVEGRPRAAT